MHVLCDQGLGSQKLWRQIVDLGWHPVLRYPLPITFRPASGDRVPARQLGGGSVTLWLGEGTAFGRDPLPGTRVVLHAQGQREPWLLLTDTPPDRTDVDLYACRHWIEQGFRGCQRGGWQWQRTRRRDPVRVARHLLVLAVATLLAVAYGRPLKNPTPLPSRQKIPLTRAPASLEARTLAEQLPAEAWTRRRVSRRAAAGRSMPTSPSNG